MGPADVAGRDPAGCAQLDQLRTSPLRDQRAGVRHPRLRGRRRDRLRPQDRDAMGTGALRRGRGDRPRGSATAS
jgi:hypothetical protein